jgi:hypothetical protein
MRDHDVKNTVLSEVTASEKVTSTKQYTFNTQIYDNSSSES